MKNSLLKYYIAAVYLCSTVVSFAAGPGIDDGTGTLEGTDPAAPAPIGDHLWVLALAGLILVFMVYRANQNKKIRN